MQKFVTLRRLFKLFATCYENTIDYPYDKQEILIELDTIMHPCHNPTIFLSQAENYRILLL
jgi:hypothetical protein